MLAITDVAWSPLRARLTDPFVIATARLEQVDNVAVKVVLSDGSEGWAEIGTLHPVTAETAADALRLAGEALPELVGMSVGDEPAILSRLNELLPGSAATRAGIEGAITDARAKAMGIPLWKLFGRTQAPVVTDVTIPICAPARATELAAQWRRLGFDILKLKVGRAQDEDIKRITAVVRGHPEAGFLLDANEGWSVQETLEVIAACERIGARIVLLEQPLPREDLDGMARLVRDAGVPIGADESCRSLTDALRLIKHHAANVINVKVAKTGIAETVAIVGAARLAGLGTMIGGMVESRIGTGISAHLAAGLGGFTLIDLDTPLLFAEDPIAGGARITGARWILDAPVGHGGQPLGVDRDAAPAAP